MNQYEAAYTIRPARLTVDQFAAIDDCGALARLGRTELRGGAIYQIAAQYSDHAVVKGTLYNRLYDVATRVHGLHVIVEVTVRVGEHDAPEPDIIICRHVRRRSFVAVKDVILAVEVSSTTLDDDLGYKAQLYASAGVPEYWVVDTVGERVLRMWAPAADGYARDDELPFGATVAMITRAEIALSTADLFAGMAG